MVGEKYENFKFRTHFTKTFMFKLIVLTEIANAQTNDIKEISFISSVIVAFAFFLFLSVLICVSKCRRRSKLLERDGSPEEKEAVIGDTLHQFKSIRKYFREVVFPAAESLP